MRPMTSSRRGVCGAGWRETRTDEWSIIINRIGAAATKGKWASDVIATAVLDLETEHDFLVVVDLDGCVREGRGGEHAEWIRSRAALDFSRLGSGKSGLEEAIARISEKLLAD